MKTQLVVVVAGAVAALAGSPALAQITTPPLQIQEHVLENGFTILLVEDRRMPRVAANLWVRVGSMAEPVGLHGVTHFLEHVIHQGTTTVGTSDLAGELPILQETHDTEQELIAVRNRERNQLRERDVFYDEIGWPVTPEIEALRERLYELEDRDNEYRDFWTSYNWYMQHGGYVRHTDPVPASTEQDYMEMNMALPREHLELFFRLEADRLGQRDPEGLGGAALHRAGADPRGKEPAADPLQRGDRRRHGPGAPGLCPRRRARPRLRELHPGRDVPDLRRLLRAQQRGAGAGRRRDVG